MNLHDLFHKPTIGESSESYILYVNDKPYTTYDTLNDAKSTVVMLKQKFPSKQFQIKKEVCDIIPLTQETAIPNDVSEKKDPCWKGYKQVGMKAKNKKSVPNCVPVSENIEKEMYHFIKLLEYKSLKPSGRKYASK
jgi:hypothetical protein